MIPANAPLPFDDYQASSFQHTQMLHDRAAVDPPKVRTEITGSPGLVFQVVEYGPAARAGQRAENEVLTSVN